MQSTETGDVKKIIKKAKLKKKKSQHNTYQNSISYIVVSVQD
jgi:hypothetical protein